MRAPLLDPPPELFFAEAEERLEAERLALFFEPPPLLFLPPPPPLLPPRFELTPPFLEAPPFFAAALRAGALEAALRFEDEAAPFDDFFADFLDEEALEDEEAFDDDAFEADFFEDFVEADDFFEDLPADLPDDLAALFAEDFFALFFAAILFLLFKSFGWGAVRFDERTCAASCNPVHELHKKQCRRT